MNRQQYGDLIAQGLLAERQRMKAEFQSHPVQSCFIDNLLPEQETTKIFESFPAGREMDLRKNLREYKFASAQMNKSAPVLEEIIYAFQEPDVIAAVAEITGIKELQPDTRLYAGGISLMAKDHFLNPHLDNSHDKNRELYRVLNLLFYVSPNWTSECGGNLELWDTGPKGAPREITSRFNRLVIMATHRRSWHSVNKVAADGVRCCVSNYYFSAKPLEDHEYFHVTSFRGRPEQPVRDVVLQGDGALRQGIRKIFKQGIAENPHFYKKD